MTVRQKFLQTFYPVLMWLSAFGKKNQHVALSVKPAVTIYDQHATEINGGQFHFSQAKGKKLLIVNTASDCGYTKQLGELESLYRSHSGGLMIIGFPSNDFKEQESGTDESIANFCKIHYGVSFPLMKKTHVRHDALQHPIYKWLSNPLLNGWNNKAPQWNFCKYVIDENGKLTHVFGPAVSPLGKEMASALKSSL